VSARLVRAERDGPVAVITLDREHARNALCAALVEQLLAAVTDAAHDDAVRCVVLTGAGERAFCAGADIDELRRRDHRTESAPGSPRRELAALLEAMPKPTIAALNGHALGGGLELAMACTFRLAVPRARLGLPEIRLGIMPGNGGTQRLVRLVGLGRALELVLTGTPIAAAEAERVGLVNRVVEPGALLAEAKALAGALARSSPTALAAAKESVLLAGDVPLAAGLAHERSRFAVLCGSPDKDEGIRAFREGREPRFETKEEHVGGEAGR
jgi:enoyl-CoA hydratase